MPIDKGPWAPFEPTDRDPWDAAKVAHLHRRAGFGATRAEVTRDVKDGPAASIDRLLAGKSRLRGVPEDFSRATDTLARVAIRAEQLERLAIQSLGGLVRVALRRLRGRARGVGDRLVAVAECGSGREMACEIREHLLAPAHRLERDAGALVEPGHPARADPREDRLLGHVVRESVSKQISRAGFPHVVNHAR